MKHNPFSVEFRTASFVPRWSIVWTQRAETVASHSFYVVLYSAMIAETIKWQGNREYMMLHALSHDLDETITGDIVGPVKNNILDQERTDDFVNPKMEDRMGFFIDTITSVENTLTIREIEEAEAIVHVADKLDALLFLMVEYRMGNSVVVGLIEKALLAVEGAWRNLPGDPHDNARTWQTVALPAINAHKTEGGAGV